MFYTYVIQSEKDSKNYIGYTSDLQARLAQHDKGEVTSTKHRRPFKLIYYEACLNQQDAKNREKYFKTHYGRMYLKKRLAGYYEDSCCD